MAGPTVVPGDYQVQLHVGDESMTQSFALLPDPAASASKEDLQAQFDLLSQIYKKYDEGTIAVNKMYRLRQQLKNWAERLAKDEAAQELSDYAKQLQEQILEVEKVLLYPDLPTGWAGKLNYGIQSLRKLVSLPNVVALGDYRPTDQAHAVYDKLAGEIDEQIAKFDAVLGKELVEFNQALSKAGISFFEV
jgi:hypothetical protein